MKPDAAGDSLHIRADFLGQVGNLIDERDLCGEKRVRSIFDELSGAASGVQNGRLIEVEWPVDFRKESARTVLVSAGDNTIGMFEVLDRSSFAQEFWVRHDGKISIWAGFAHDAVDLIAGADGDGRFRDNHSEAIKCGGYFSRSCVDI